MKRVLIAGASVAGPVLAWWLDRFGFTATLVEKAPSPRSGGHAVDIRGAALDVIRAMGLHDEIAGKRTRMTGVSKLNAAGEEVWRSEEMTISGGSFGTEAIEIMRDDLSRSFIGALNDGIERVYGDTVTGLVEDADGITATFARAAPCRFDLVIGADGLRSPLRRMVFGPDIDFLRPFDMVIAPYTAPNILDLKDWQVTYDAGSGTCVIYTEPGNRALRVCFVFAAAIDEIPRDRPGQINLVRYKCAQLGWQIPRLLDHIDSAEDFYLGPVAQVDIGCWRRGRVTLVGDAAYCPSPMTGQGSSLAVVGAYVLAWQLANAPHDYAAALSAYEARMRPFVAINHKIADLTCDPRFGDDPHYYLDMIEPAMKAAERAIDLPAF